MCVPLFLHLYIIHSGLCHHSNYLSYSDIFVVMVWIAISKFLLKFRSEGVGESAGSVGQVMNGHRRGVAVVGG